MFIKIRKAKKPIMTKTKFLEGIRCLLNQQIGLSLDEKLAVVRKCLIELQKKADLLNKENKGRPWTDEELRVVLRHSPTQENCMLLARGFRRGYGSIEEIFRFAALTNKEVAANHPDDTFIQQIKRIAREIGWRAY